MATYINPLRNLIIEYIAREVSSSNFFQGTNGDVGINFQQKSIVVRKDIEEGTLYVCTRDAATDIILARALGKLHADHGYSVSRFDAENGKRRYYVRAVPGQLEDEDLGELRDGETLANLLENEPPTGNATNTILNRAARLGRPLSHLPHWKITQVDKKGLH